MKIILIDDEPLILEELSYLCEKHKDIEICGKFVNPKQALQYVAGHPVDFAFCDIRMPGITGLELLDQMHKEKPGVYVLRILPGMQTAAPDPDVQYNLQKYALLYGAHLPEADF